MKTSPKDIEDFQVISSMDELEQLDSNLLDGALDLFNYESTFKVWNPFLLLRIYRVRVYDSKNKRIELQYSYAWSSSCYKLDHQMPVNSVKALALLN